MTRTRSSLAVLWLAAMVACGGGDGGDDAPAIDGPGPIDAAPTATLTIVLAGDGAGTVTSPAGLDCGGTCAITVPTGTSVTITAAADADSTFVGWTGGGCSGSGPCVVQVVGDLEIEASFALDHALVVTLAGNGAGRVTSTPPGIDCGSDCDEAYDVGTAVTLTAIPAAGSTFTGWSGDCTGSGSCSVTLDAPRMTTATFALVQHTLTVTKVGTGSGTVTSSPAGIDCGADCDEAYDLGTVVTLTAAAMPSSTFTGWSGGGCSGGSPVCTTTVSAAATVTATFTQLPVWDGTWTGTTSQGRPITLTVVDNAITQVQVGWQIAACGTSGTTTTTFGGGGIAINPTTGTFSRSAPGTPLSYTISGTFALDASGASGTINFTFSQPFPPFCSGSASATWSATR